jgi:two-component system cell cycle sensor histidine kinase/response regulator CckA
MSIAKTRRKAAAHATDRDARVRTLALPDEERRYRDLLAGASDWIWEMDAELRFSYFSPNYQNASGVAPQRILGKRREEFAGAATAAEAEAWRAHLATLAAHQPFRDFTYRLQDDAAARWIRISGHPVFAADGAFAGYRGTGKDVTAEVELANTLRDNEERFRQLSEVASDWFWEQDSEGRLTHVSKRHELVTGSTRSKNMGLRRDEYGDTSIDPEAWRAYRQALDERRPFRDFIYRHARPDANGRIRWTKTSGFPVFDADGTFGGYRGVACDVTAQVQAQEQLRESEERYRQLFEAASDWFWEMDAELRLSHVSNSHLPVTGLPAKSNIGKRREEFGDASVNPEAWQKYFEAVAARKPFRDFIYRRLSAGPDGKPRWTKTSGVPIFAPDGTFRGYRGAACDVTAQIEAETQQRELEAQLHQSQKLEALGQLAGGVAHDLNNSLVPVLGMMKLLRAKLPEGSPERGFLDIMQIGAKRAKELVQQILDFSRKEEAEKRPLDLAAVIAEAMTMLQASVPATIRLVTAIENVPKILGDGNRLNQVIVNLVTNASHAIGTTAGSITIALRPRGADAVVLEVADTGSGMEEAVRRRIFEPFFTTKAVGKGTGLGLSVVHGILKTHDATIACESSPGAGTRFEIVFPAAPPT